MAMDLGEFEAFVVDQITRVDGGRSLREPIRAYAEQQGIPLG
jgi:phosphotransferase system, enzyme I, PtsP